METSCTALAVEIQVPMCGVPAIRILKTMGEVGQIPLAHVSSLPRKGHTHHLLVLLQQWTGQVQLREGIDRHEGEPGRWRTDGLHHSGFHSREGVREAGPIPHGQGDDLEEQKEQQAPEHSPLLSEQRLNFYMMYDDAYAPSMVYKHLRRGRLGGTFWFPRT